MSTTSPAKSSPPQVVPAFDASQAEAFLWQLGSRQAAIDNVDPFDVRHVFVAIAERPDTKTTRLKIDTRFGIYDDHSLWIEERTTEGYGIFIAVNRFDGITRSAKTCTGLRAIMLDCDAGLPNTATFPLQPSLIVRTSPGKAHFYWLMQDLSLSQAASWKDRQSALIANFSGDAAVKDLPRIMRLPGTVNWKTNPHIVTVEVPDTGASTYTMRHLETAFPTPISPTCSAKGVCNVPDAVNDNVQQWLDAAKSSPAPSWATVPVVVETYSPLTSKDRADMVSAIDHLGSATQGAMDDRAVWIAVCGALAGEVHRGRLTDEEGHDLFVRFSLFAGNAASTDAELWDKWRDLADRSRGDCGIGTLRREAKNRGWIEPAPPAPAHTSGTALLACDLPAGFRVVSTSEGREWIIKDDVDEDGQPGEQLFVCTRVDFLAKARDEHGHGWGKIIRIHHSDGATIEVFLPEKTVGDERALRSWLLHHGAKTAAGISKKASAELLYLFNRCDPLMHARRTDRLGWREGKIGEVFVTPQGVVGSSNEMVIYTGNAPSCSPVAGTLQEWKDAVAGPLARNPYGVLALGVSLAGPLLKLAHEPGSIFHLYGETTSGKSSFAMAATSVWGHGKHAMRNWNATTCGLEAAAAVANDTCLVLDELGQAKDGDAVAQAIYDLTNGAGATRMTQTTDLRDGRKWTTNVLSTGEFDFATHIARNGGALQGGQTVRGIELMATDAKYKAFHDIGSHRDGASFSAAVVSAAQSNYGVAGAAFVETLADDPQGASSALSELLKRFNDAVATRYPGASAEAKRVAKAFGLVHAALSMATACGVLPFLMAEVAPTMLALYDKWMHGSGFAGGHTRVERDAVDALATFLIEHRAQLAPWKAIGYAPMPRDCLGFVETDATTGDEKFWLTTTGFDQMARGARGSVAAALVKAGKLAPLGAHGHPKAKWLDTTRGRKNVRLYEILG